MRRLFAGFLAALALTSALAATVEYVDLSEARPDDDSVRILSTGDKYSSFERDGPFVLDPQFLQEYGSLGYLHVHYQPNGDNDYKGQSSQYVASIKDASVCGSEGDVWDSQGRLYRMNTWVRHPVSKLEAWKAEAESHGVKHFKRLASAVHRVSFMYFHFMAEALPRITKFAPYLKADPELMLLTYGSSFERAWIQKLGIRSEQVVTFDPLFAYHADELLVSNPVEIARTPREDLQEMLSQLGLPAPLPADQRTDLVYVSRRLAADRIQTNEDALLTALEAEAKAQGLRLVVHDGNPSLTADDTIEMFRRARAVGTARASEALLFSIYKVLTNQTTSLNISSPAVQRSIAKYALASVDVDEPLFRRSLAERRVLQNGVSADDLTAAIADSVSTSVSIQVAAVDRLAAAIAAGSALSIADISNILTQAAQAAMAQRTVAGAASSMAAGTLSVTSFRASYTGDALLAYINSIIVTLPELTASDYHKKKTNVGAIVGGTIGGFFGLVLIIVLVVVLVRRNKAHVQPRQQGDVENK
ncbi:hypothetical protein GPECTOR_8g389 [Gonium pectorale]|uniref:Glycosyltransferase 61 catalytic domain-containing protein n=1 Tax=Gonium pectorale TaxID=33097 RepID=A0A150GT90_GONPE|nr:hypothetical protein GPECTOR_8g389 [Gonium pectorale]|eukprot:KXZ53021.1 hypothetical protein GPECTOR_8g389 [Gonium pectorale]